MNFLIKLSFGLDSSVFIDYYSFIYWLSSSPKGQHFSYISFGSQLVGCCYLNTANKFLANSYSGIVRSVFNI